MVAFEPIRVEDLLACFKAPLRRHQESSELRIESVARTRPAARRTIVVEKIRIRHEDALCRRRTAHGGCVISASHQRPCPSPFLQCEATTRSK